MREHGFVLTTLFVLTASMSACDRSSGAAATGGVLGEAEEHAKTACECADKACAMKEVAALNKISVMRGEELSALGEEDKKKYDEAVERASTCRDEKE